MKKALLTSILSLAFLNGKAQTGIGTTAPVNKLEVVTTKADPATTGNIANGNFRIGATVGTHILDFGLSSTSTFSWLQARDKSSYATNYILSLNPNGGNVGINKTNPSKPLDVNGDTAISGNLTGGNSSTSTISGFGANINTQTGTTYTLTASDNGKIITLNNASAITLTVPSTLFAGFNCMIVQLGAGQITLAASGVTISNRSGFTKTGGTNAILTLLAISSTLFISSGDMSN